MQQALLVWAAQAQHGTGLWKTNNYPGDKQVQAAYVSANPLCRFDQSWVWLRLCLSGRSLQRHIHFQWFLLLCSTWKQKQASKWEECAQLENSLNYIIEWRDSLLMKLAMFERKFCNGNKSNNPAGTWKQECSTSLCCDKTASYVATENQKEISVF